jgi:glycine betaine/proline transport system substrate-binding protein
MKLNKHKRFPRFKKFTLKDNFTNLGININPEQLVSEEIKNNVADRDWYILSKSMTYFNEGLWITPGTIDKHSEIKGMTAMQILEHPEWFPSKEDPSKGAFVGCAAGWRCQLPNNGLFDDFEMKKKGWVLVDPGKGLGLEKSIAEVAERRKPWFEYHWGPSTMVGKYNLTPIDFGVDYAGDEHWNGCIVKPEQKCSDPKPSAWIKNKVHTVVTANFKKTGGDAVMKYVMKRTYPADVMNGMLVYMSDNQASGEDAALEFFRKHEDVWTQWVSEDVAKKIKAGL